MKQTLLATAAALALAGCAGGDRGGLYLAVGLETAIGTLISLEQTGTLPPEGAGFIDATLGYGGEACGILADPALTPEEKRLSLLTELSDERAAFDSAFSSLVGAGLDKEIMLVVIPAINGARAAVRIALTEEIDPSRYDRACATVQSLQRSWDLQHSLPELAPM